MDRIFSLNELCEELKISKATGLNWIKTGKISFVQKRGKEFYFSVDYVQKLKEKIINSSYILKKRRNKKHSDGTIFYKDYLDQSSPNIAKIEKLIKLLNNNDIKLDENIVKSILADTADKLFISKKICIKNFDFLVKDINKTYKEIKNFYPEIFSIDFEYFESEDLLGLMYMSLKSMCERKNLGAYYTPTKIVKKLCAITFKNFCNNMKILDPCCGSGNFLLQLPKEIEFKQIYASDIDPIAIKLCRINIALKYNIFDKNFLFSHIKMMDFLDFSAYNNVFFDYIIGNPPWGALFDKNKINNLKDRYITAKQGSIESYDIVTEKALSLLNLGGILTFILPEAILNVKSHNKIRRMILKISNVNYIEYLGEIFNKVHCPSIIFSVTKTNKKLETTNTRIKDRNREFIIHTNRQINSNTFNLNVTDEEYRILQKIDNHKNKATLKNHCDFALGIVTGDNKKYITVSKTNSNEPIIRGADIEKYNYTVNNYIEFIPKNFQQVAPIVNYRASEKIIYKFITNKLAFAYDNTGILTLNSCNILIPKINGLNIKYILAILNSSVAQFYFSKMYNSKKVLRSHIESIPIAVSNQNMQNEIIKIVDKIISCSSDNKKYKQELDYKIAKIYGLKQNEYYKIQNSMT